MNTLISIKNNFVYLIVDCWIWIVVWLSHLVSYQIQQPTVVKMYPYFQIVAVTLAGVASLLTIIKIVLDIHKGK